ncbi:MAG: TIM44-like domain-containing protein [Zetaproteobacteria bacterium]|nr:TIM44-like domain-containing protein [Zetaproteobacteria bacterium]
MKNLLKSFALIFTLACIVPYGAVDAEAKRFGGGKSFGQQRMASPAQKSPAMQNNASSSTAKKSGFMSGGLMGGLAGLAMGGLLGAMLFGGAFEGINFVDILLFAGVAFLLYMVFKRKGQQPANRTAYAGHPTPPMDQQNSLDAEPMQRQSQAMGSSQPESTAIKSNLDLDFFTQASRDIFVRMQKAWDAKDIHDIRSFCTPEISERIAQEMEQSGDVQHQTEAVTLAAEVLSSWHETDLDWVAVHFTAMMRESTLDAGGKVLESSNSEVNETWIFQHNPTSEDPTWYLAGIQQA